jgi:hypothetical protein
VTSIQTTTSTSLVDEIAFRLEAAILEGECRPGTHLLHDELCSPAGLPCAKRSASSRRSTSLCSSRTRAQACAFRRTTSCARCMPFAELEGFACDLPAT